LFEVGVGLVAEEFLFAVGVFVYGGVGAEGGEFSAFDGGFV